MILDSSFLIDLMASEAAAVAKLDGLVEDGYRLSVATLSVTEVTRGLEDGSTRAAFERILEDVDVAPFDRSAAMRAGELLRELDRRGEPVGAVDAMVAATALERDGVVVTRNVSEFRRIEGLRVEPY